MSSLRAFEAAARLGSFSDAALELSLTTSAVSHQVRSLESFMRLALFTRERQRVRLSEAGRRLMPFVQRALRDLSDGMAQVRQERVAASVTVLPSIANRWLLSRLGGFSIMYPDVDLHVSSSQAVLDLSREGIDLGIRFGGGTWPGVHSVKLADEALLPVASPELLRSIGSRNLSVLTRATLLRDDLHMWSDYLQANGFESDGLRFGTQFGDSAQLLESAEAGHGLALGRAWLSKDALSAGALVALGPPMPLPDTGYHLVSQVPIEECSTGARAFAKWLQALFRAETCDVDVQPGESRDAGRQHVHRERAG